MSMFSNPQPCPIWDGVDDIQFGALLNPTRSPILCDYPRAGGYFGLEYSGAELLRTQPLTDRRKANLSYWIYKHNLEHRLFDPSNLREENLLVLNRVWVEGNRDRTPSSPDRMLTFLRELIRCDDAYEQPNASLLLAAGGCRSNTDRDELLHYAMAQGWLGGTMPGVGPFHINLPARMHVETQLGVLGRSRQGFVAMWFDPSMDKVYEDGIKPAIEAAGYEARRIDRKEFVGGVFDEIMAEIRKSRFVVADFTTSPESGARGGVYLEAGFALGLGIPVVHTCREDCKAAVHFDTSHLNHLFWENPEDLRTSLKSRIEAVLGHGPFRTSGAKP